MTRSSGSLVSRLLGRSSLALPSRGRLPANEMYPLGTGSVKARFVELRSGFRIRVAECGPADGSPLLLLHGWGGSLYGFRKNMPTLGAAGFRVVAADLLGHGLSDKPTDVARYTRAAILAQIEEIMDALEMDAPTLVGQSMAGQHVLNFAIERPSRVSTVIVINGTGLGYIRGIGVVTLLAKMPPKLHLWLTTRRFMVKRILKRIYGKLGAFSERDVDEYWAPSQYTEWGHVLVTLLRINPWGRVPPGEYAEVQQPTLVITSSDPLVRTGSSEELQKRIPPHSTVVHVADGGHLVNEEAPEPVNAAILAFLAEN